MHSYRIFAWRNVTAAALLLLAAGSVHAQTSEIAAPTLLRAAPARLAAAGEAVLAAFSPEGTLREREVAVDFTALSAAQASLAAGAGVQRMRLVFFDDTSLLVEITAVARTASGGLAYTGRVADLPASAVVLVDNGGAISFNVSTHQARFVVHGSADAGYLAREISTAELPDHPPAAEAPAAAPAPAAAVSFSTGVALPSVTMDTGAGIDVMVLYTPAARLANGGSAQMNANVDAQIALTNVIYANSGVAQRVRLVYKGEIAHSETNMATDLQRLTQPGDGYLDDAPALRDLYGADVVSLWGVYPGACGLSNIMATEAASFAPFAYSVVASPSCTSANQYSFAHEMGHNMGLLHDPFVTDNTPTFVTPEAGGVLTGIGYAHGYVDLANRFRTVMAYSNQCDDAHVSCLRIPYFSNPALTFNNSGFYAAAVPAILGNAATSREFQVLNDTRETVANFRTLLTSLTGPGVVRFLPSTAYSVVRSAGSVQLRVARHAGTTGIVSVAYATGNGSALAGTDFAAASGTLTWQNGDSAEKILTITLKSSAASAVRSFNVKLGAPQGGVGIGSASGADMTATVAIVPPVAWARQGGIDMDGDGRSEILIRNDAAQLQAGRLVNNALQFAAIADPGPAYRVLGVADFVGSGRSALTYQNVVASADSGDIHVWPDFQQSADIFLRTVKFPWVLQALGDLDGDGYGDLLFRYTGDDGNANDTGVSYIWFSNGSGISMVRKRGGAPLTWTLLGAQDINGDGAADLIFVGPDNSLRALLATANRTCANFAAGSVPAGFSAVKLSDFTGGQRGDILVRNSSTGAVQLLSLNAGSIDLPAYVGSPDDYNASCTGTSLKVPGLTTTLPSVNAAWTFWASGDLNGDGIVDIVWKQPDGTLTVWLMKANGVPPTVIANAGKAPLGFSVIQP